jgi:hypothetical protein
MSAQHETTDALGQCSACGNPASKALLAEAQWYPYWDREDGACPACVQENLLRILLAKGDAALHEAIQTAWPLDAEAAFGVLPTRLRLHADPRFSGRGVTLALVDSGCQGAGALSPGTAVARALAERHGGAARLHRSPGLSAEGITFSLHDHDASRVQLLGSWNDWHASGIAATSIEPGYWQTLPVSLPTGRYAYKFLLDGQHWLDHPGNPARLMTVLAVSIVRSSFRFEARYHLESVAQRSRSFHAR